MLTFQPAREDRCTLDLEATGGGVSDGGLGPPFGGLQATGGEAEGVPAEAEPSPQPDQGDRQRDHE